MVLAFWRDLVFGNVQCMVRSVWYNIARRHYAACIKLFGNFGRVWNEWLVTAWMRAVSFMLVFALFHFALTNVIHAGVSYRPFGSCNASRSDITGCEPSIAQEEIQRIVDITMRLWEGAKYCRSGLEVYRIATVPPGHCTRQFQIIVLCAVVFKLKFTY